MRNLLLILLLANILYFMWGWLSHDDAKPGVALIDEADLGPPLEMAQKRPQAEDVESVGAVLGSGEGTDLIAVVGRSCVTIGPLRESDDADEAAARYAAENMRTKIRSGFGQVFVGHWVQVRDVPSRDEANRMIGILHEAGLTDAYMVETEDEGIKISLGLFGNLDSAERIELEATSLGLPADIAPRMADSTIYWVDVALLPGRGAGDIVELYGEDKVKLRGEATCPGGGVN